MDEKLKVIGTSLKRVDAQAKVCGKTLYTPDIYIDSMCYAYPFYSKIPSGKIISVDLEKAEKSEGFIRAITADDIPGENQVGVIFQDQELLVTKKVRYIGDSIGVIVAETAESAYKISHDVDIEYEKTEAILSISESKNQKAGFIHKNNIACQHKVINGNVKEGFNNSDLIVEAEFTSPYQEHYYLEPQGCIAIPESDGSITIRGSVQCIFYVQKAISKILNISMNRINVIQEPVGGAFGGKEDIPSEVCARAALAAIKVNRPVKMIYRRHDDVQLTSKRHPFEMKYKLGLNNNGKILAAEIELDENAGAYATLSSVVSYRATMQAIGPYTVPNVKVHSTAWYTNLPPTGAFRGFGSPQVTFAAERMMEIAASRLGMDSIQFRKINMLENGSKTITGQKLNSSVGALQTLEFVLEDNTFENTVSNGRYLYGTGLASMYYGNCLGAAGWALDGAGVKIQVRRDGSITLAYGLVEMGQGSLTAIVQMTAEALGVKPQRIHVLPTESSQVPDSGPSVASRNVVMTGNAIRNAGEKLQRLFKKAASKLLNCDSDSITINDDIVYSSDIPDTLTFAQLAEYLYVSNYAMDATGWWHVPALEYDAQNGLGEAYFTYSYATHKAWVKIDRLTGKVKVEKIVAAHDVGRAINPAGIEAQVEGGVLQGLGWALTEDLKLENGKVTTANLSTYLLPGAMDIPEVKTIIVEDQEPEGPWGAKGIGEPAIIPTAAAIANAVSNALGKEIFKIPILPEDILDLITAD